MLLAHPSFYRIQNMRGVQQLPPLPESVYGNGAIGEFHATGGVVLPYDGLDYGDEDLFNLDRLVRLCAPPGTRLEWPRDLLRSVLSRSSLWFVCALISRNLIFASPSSHDSTLCVFAFFCFTSFSFLSPSSTPDSRWLLCRMLTYCAFPARERGVHFVWDSARAVAAAAVAPDFVPFRRDFVNPNINAAPFWDYLIDLYNIPSLTNLPINTVIFVVQEETVFNFPRGLYRANVLLRLVLQTPHLHTPSKFDSRFDSMQCIFDLMKLCAPDRHTQAHMSLERAHPIHP